MRNQGEIPQYYMIGSYEAIIDKRNLPERPGKTCRKQKEGEPSYS